MVVFSGRSAQGLGAFAGVAANASLGASSLFWRELSAVSPLTLLAYRILVSLFTLAAFMGLLGLFAGARAKLNPKIFFVHACAACFVVVNWGTFIWASIHGHVVESGLGYLIAPFAAIGVGALAFSERVTRLRWCALSVICAAVLMLMACSGELKQWIYLVIGASWGGYACLKKITPLDPFAGLLMETAVLGVLLIIPLSFSFITLSIPIPLPYSTLVLLACCGAVSVIPLWLFAYAAGRLPLSVMGFFQFVLPATQFIVALTVYRQHVSINTAFGLASFSLRYCLSRGSLFWGDMSLADHARNRRMKRYDAVVIGLGVMGAATILDLARSGADVLGMDAFGPTHASGSSHGATRIFRRAYWESENYLPLLRRAHEGWLALQSKAEELLLTKTGGLYVSPAAGGVATGSLRAAAAGNIPYDDWDAATIRKRFPAFRVANDMRAVYERDAYAIAADRARLRMLDNSVCASATIWHGERVCEIEESHGSLRVSTKTGASVLSKIVVLTTGPWIREFLPELDACLSPRRVPIYWFEPKRSHADTFDAGNFPVFLYEFEDGSLLYGVPSITSAERGVKIGFHNRQQQLSSPDDESAPEVSLALKDEISERVREMLPTLQDRPAQAKWCFYTMSRDESFIIGTSHRHVGVFYASACSGHGFKFAPAIGEAMSCLVRGEPPPVDLSPFSVRRFSAP